MYARAGRMVAILALLFTFLIISSAEGAGKSPVSVPDGVKVGPIKYGDEETEAKLKPEEQVAFLFVSAIWGLEGDCINESGVGRLCSIVELVKGVHTQGGETIGLKVDPKLDTNYSYDITIVGGDCMIRAVPQGAGLGAFGLAGSPRRGSGNFYYNPKGPDLVRGTVKLTEYGYGGEGFRR